MRGEVNRPTGCVLAAAVLVGVGGLLSPASLAQTAGGASGLNGASDAGEAAALATLDRADALAKAGKVVEARAALTALTRSADYVSIPSARRTGAMELARSLDGRLRSLDPVEVSLQKAELALAEGDLKAADVHAGAVTARVAASDEQKARAKAALEGVARSRAEIAPAMRTTLARAAAGFEAGRFAQAKAGLAQVARSGVPLNSEEQHLADRYQIRLIDLERSQGHAFDAGAPAMAAVQPGKVRRTGRDQRNGQPANQQTQPARTQPGDQPSTQPEQPLTPASEPMEQAPEPAPYQPAPSQPASYQPAQPMEQPAPAAEPMRAQDAPSQPASSSPQPSGAWNSSGSGSGNVQDDLIQAALRVEAQRILAEADLAFTEGRYSEAIDKYTISTTSNRRFLTDEDLRRGEDRLTDARTRLQSNTGTNLGADVVAGIGVIREQVAANFNNYMDQARQAISAGDAGRARDLAAQARLTVNNGRGVLSETEQRDYLKRVDDLSRQIESDADRIRIQAESAQAKATAQAASTRERETRSEKSRKIDDAIGRVRALQQEQKYEEALQVIDQVLFLDPGNPSGLLLRDIIGDVIAYQRFNNIQRIKRIRDTEQGLNNSEAMIAPHGIVDYPTDWPALSFRRGELSAYAEPPENRRVLAELDNKKIPVDFTDNSFADVLSFIETVSQVNTDIDWESLKEIGIDRESRITLKLSAVPVRVVLDRVLEKVSKDQFSRAGWAVNQGVLQVSSDEKLRKQTTLVIYNITDMLLEVPNYYDAPQIDLQGVLQQSQGGGGGGGQSPFRDQQQQRQRDPQEREMRIRRLTEIIQANVDFEGWKENGGDTGAIQELNGSLIIKNTPRNHREIAGLLSKLREIRSMQINVETKFLLVNQNWFEQIGFDIDLVINANGSQVRAAQAIDPTIQAGDFFDFSGAAGGNRGLQRNVTGAFTPLGTTAANAQATRTSQGVINPRPFSPVAGSQDSLGLANSLVEGDFANSIVARAPALGIAGQFLDDIQVDFLITATQADKRSVQLTAPRLTFTNGQTSNIFVVTQQAFVSDLTPVVGDSAVGFDPTVAVVSEGVTMLVEGVISADRRYVTLNVDAGVSRIDGFAQQAVTAVAGGQLVNSASAQSFIQLPTVTVTRVRTTVTVPDEGTVLLGGQRLVTELEIETGVPVLSKIPIINRFFTNRIESKTEQTLLILIKPTVLIQTEEEEKNFPGLLDSLKTGIGIR